jgi:sugar phosphate isomerase/epimerase
MIKNIYFALTAILLISLSSCSDNSSKTVNSWDIGTSSGLFDEFSQSEFDKFRIDGINCIEIGSGVFTKKTREEREAWIEDIRQKTEKSGIKVWSIHLPFSRIYDISSVNDTHRINMIKECVDIITLCEPLNPEKFVIHGSSEPISDAERSQRITNCIESLKILTEEVKKYNAGIAIECLPRTCLGNTADELIRIVNSVGNGLEICFDSNHLLKEKPEEFVAKAGNLITTVHMSDYDGIDERHWLPGMGIINWTNVISELVKSGYKGPFMFEASRRKPSADGTTDKTKLTTEELVSSFNQLKTNFLGSLK